MERRINLLLKMLGVKKTENSFLKANLAKLKTIVKFVDLPLTEVINASLYLGLYKIWLPIAKIIEMFPDWGIDSGEETEKLYNLKQKYKKEVHVAYKIIQNIETIEKKFNSYYSDKHFKSDSEYYKAFIDYVESQVEEKTPQPSKQIKKIVKKVIPLNVKGTTRVEEPSVPKKVSPSIISPQSLLKGGIFVLSFITPMLLFLILAEQFFYWNFVAMLRYQTVLFFLIIIIFIFWGIISGWLSLLLTRYYLKSRKKRLKSKKDRREYKKWKREFSRKNPYSRDEKTPTQWYNELEKFVGSKN